VALDQLDGQTRLSNSTTTDDHQLVFSEKLARVSDRNAKGERRAGAGAGAGAAAAVVSTFDAIVNVSLLLCRTRTR